MTQKNRPQNDCQVLSQEILDIVQDPHLDTNPELHYQQKDEYSRLADALEQLPFNEKQVLIMRYYNDMKLEEIAAAMEISRSSVKTLYCLRTGSFERKNERITDYVFS